jgi:hypothetical protein
MTSVKRTCNLPTYLQATILKRPNILQKLSHRSSSDIAYLAILTRRGKYARQGYADTRGAKEVVASRDEKAVRGLGVNSFPRGVL